MTARGGGPNRSDHRFVSGAFVEYGTSSPHGGDRLGEVVRENREYGQDGYLIRPLSGMAGDGYLSETYPGRMVMAATMSRWTSDGRKYVRNYSEIKPAPAQNDGAEVGCLWCAGSVDIVTDADAQLCRVHLAEFDGVSVAQLDRADDAAAYDQL